MLRIIRKHSTDAVRCEEGVSKAMRNVHLLIVLLCFKYAMMGTLQFIFVLWSEEGLRPPVCVVGLFELAAAGSADRLHALQPDRVHHLPTRDDRGRHYHVRVAQPALGRADGLLLPQGQGRRAHDGGHGRRGRRSGLRFLADRAEWRAGGGRAAKGRVRAHPARQPDRARHRRHPGRLHHRLPRGLHGRPHGAHVGRPGAWVDGRCAGHAARSHPVDGQPGRPHLPHIHLLRRRARSVV